MICKCGKSKTSVADSRPFNDGKAVWRRRVCKKCDKSFVTFEVDSSQVSMGGKITWRSQDYVTK
jgi:transcriptional regulator NrdR family protein